MSQTAKTIRVMQAPDAPPPLDDPVQVSVAIKDIGHHQRSLMDIQVDMDEQIAEVRQRYSEAINEHKVAMDLEITRVQEYCLKHKGDLFVETRKVDFVSGVVGLKISPPAVVIEDEDSVLFQLKQAKKLRDLIRVRESIDKVAFKKAHEAGRLEDIEGYEIVQKETFYIEPAATKVSITLA